MAIYAIGDVQGCFDTLEHLLKKIPFVSTRDQLWLTGDLVNRGPKSAETLRWARASGATTVLGNHDIHLLMRAHRLAPAKKRDTLDDVLTAPDRDALFAWLQKQPLIHVEDNHILVHGGIPPWWTLTQTIERARRAEDAIQKGDFSALSSRSGEVFETISLLTRIRVVRDDQMVDFDGAPEDAPPGAKPWFASWTGPETIVFGHWANLGRRLMPHALGLDSGCVWGNTLSAVRLGDRAVFDAKSVEF